MSKKANAQKKKRKVVRKEEVIEIDMDKAMANAPAPKNTRGELGEICAFCGGFGYTLAIVGNSSTVGCPRCFGTGVQPVDTHGLQKQVIKLAQDVLGLKKLIIKLAGKKDKKNE